MRLSEVARGIEGTRAEDDARVMYDHRKTSSKDHEAVRPRGGPERLSKSYDWNKEAWPHSIHRGHRSRIW